MKTIRHFSRAMVVLAVVAIGLHLPQTADAALATPNDAAKIMELNSVAFKVVGSESQATFVLTNKGGQERVRKTSNLTKLQANGSDNMRLTRLVSPPDVKGTTSLMIEKAAGDDGIWIYLPALRKVRRLGSSNMKDSFVGTDFSNADVIGYKLDEWTYTLLREEAVEAADCYLIQADPKNDAVRSNTGYSKRLHWIRKDNHMTAKSEFWDEAGQPLKTASYHDIQLVDAKRGKWQPMRMEAANLQTGHRTSIRFEDFKVTQTLADDLFSARSLERE